MKMKKLSLLAILLLTSLLLTSCYASREREYYSDREVFVEDTGVIENIYDNRVRNIYDHGDNIGKVIVEISGVDEIYQAETSYGVEFFSIEGKNLKILLENGLMDKMSIGTEIIYMSAPRYFGDGYKRPIVALTIEGEELLSFEEGYKNLMDTYRYIF